LPPLNELRFQPVPKSLDVEVSGHLLHPILEGDVLTLHVDVPPEGRAPAVGRLDGWTVRVVSAVPEGQGWKLRLQPDDDRGLLYTARVRGGLPERVWIEPGIRNGVVSYRLPAEAVVRDTAGARIWIAIDGWAVPVDIDELQHLRAHVLATERRGALGRPVRAEDWRAMGRAAREAVVRARHRPGQPAEADLLDDRAWVIVRPAGLGPGQRVQVRHGS
jgi:hypothetical protein